MNIDSFRCISVLGRGHFGKVKFANCRILINNNDHQFFFICCILLFCEIYIIEQLKPDKIISNCHLKIKFNEKAAFLFFFFNFKANYLDIL